MSHHVSPLTSASFRQKGAVLVAATVFVLAILGTSAVFGYSLVDSVASVFGLSSHTAELSKVTDPTTVNPTTLCGEGVLDPSFNATGYVVSDMGGDYEYIRSVVVQPDGKILAGGYIDGGGGGYTSALARYNANGALDASFGSGGKLVTPNLGQTNAIALQTDGRIVAAGNFGSDFALARFNSDGSLDTSFGTGGIVTTDFNAGDSANAMAIQPDGKIVAAGITLTSENLSRFAVARYNADGTLDASFGTGGKITLAVAGWQNIAYSVVIQQDARLVVAGTSYNNQLAKRFTLARFYSNGTIDDTFGLEGVATTAINGDSYLYAAALQPDGRIIAAGTSSQSFALARYNSDGSLDGSFGTGGEVTTWITGNDLAYSMALQTDGKIFAAGIADGGSNGDIAAVRYNANGTLDSSFNGTGKVTTTIGPNYEVGNAVAIQPDGRVVVGGGTDGLHWDFALFRYGHDCTEGSPTPTASPTPSATSTPIRTPSVVISQFDGGGGGSTGTYLNDYVELKNITSSPQSLNGLSLYYGSAAGNFASTATNAFALPNVTLNPGQYYLVQLGTAGTGGAPLPVTPDTITSNINMSGTNGKIALVTASLPINACGATATPCSAIQLGLIVDWAAYGTGGNGMAGNGEGGTSVNNGISMVSTQGAVRKLNGCQDTDNNNNDFDVIIAPVPRNMSSPTVICSASPSPTATVTPAGASISGTITYGNAIGAPAQRFVSNVQVAGSGAPNVFAVSSADGSYVLTGFGSGAYTVTPSKTGDGNGISSFDSGKIAQHAAGIVPLTGNQLIVADVSGDGTISSFDAAKIARYAAGLDNFGSTGNWIFQPQNRNYPSVAANIAGQDFIAMLMGDVSGNWMPVQIRQPASAGR